MMDKIANGVEDMKLKQIEEYEINPFTMFIKPSVYGSKIYSEIFEVEDNFYPHLNRLISLKTVVNIMDLIMKAEETEQSG